MSPEFPWYSLVADDSALEQGDLLFDCPVIFPSSEIAFPIASGNIPAVKDTFDVLVMTQSCDLANDKVTEVIVCPHWDLEEAAEQEAELYRARNAIRAGRLHRYAMLAASEIEERKTGIRVVDFGRVFSLPKDFARQVARSQIPRLRLLPPYREHVSQCFARFFMRIALPIDIVLKQ